MNHAHQRILALLENQGAEYRLHEHPAVVTVEQAEDLVPYLTRHLVKTVVFRIKEGDWILAGIPAGQRVDYGRLASFLKVSRRRLRSVAAAEVAGPLGFEIGGVGPFPVCGDCQVILDRSLSDWPVITCGSGLNTCTLELAVADLIRVSDARVESIVRPPQQDEPA